jgi:hypothetical protein
MPEPATTAVRRLAVLAAFLLTLAPAAGAQTWNEVGDAGSLVSSAQLTVGATGLSTINGSLQIDPDVDVYCVHLTATPPAGLPLVWMNCVVTNGPQVWLFDAAGNGIATNMNCQAGQKLIVAPNFSLAPGNYYVAVAYSGIEPQSAGGAIWIPNVLAQHTPDGPGAGQPLTGWAGAANPQPLNPYSLGFYGSWFGYCDAATASTRATWGTLKIRYGS